MASRTTSQDAQCLVIVPIVDDHLEQERISTGHRREEVPGDHLEPTDRPPTIRLGTAPIDLSGQFDTRPVSPEFFPGSSATKAPSDIDDSLRLARVDGVRRHAKHRTAQPGHRQGEFGGFVVMSAEVLERCRQRSASPQHLSFSAMMCRFHSGWNGPARILCRLRRVRTRKSSARSETSATHPRQGCPKKCKKR